MRVCVVDQEKFDVGPFNFGAAYDRGTLDAVISSLQAIRDSIPEQYRESASCEVGSESGYEGEHCAHIRISYDRPETAEEAIERQAKRAARIDEERARLKLKLAELDRET
jgi:hypothetical protein